MPTIVSLQLNGTLRASTFPMTSTLKTLHNSFEKVHKILFFYSPQTLVLVKTIRNKFLPDNDIIDRRSFREWRGNLILLKGTLSSPSPFGNHRLISSRECVNVCMYVNAYLVVSVNVISMRNACCVLFTHTRCYTFYYFAKPTSLRNNYLVFLKRGK